MIRRLVICVALCSACVPDLKVPSGADITCTGDGQCPLGRPCRGGRCVDPAAETDPPSLVQLSIAPNPVRAGVPVTLTVRSNEALLKPPEVTLRLAPALPPLDCQGSDSDYTCTYTATGAETEGPAPVDVRMMDLNRNEAVLKGAGTLVLDFTPPALAANSVSPPQSRFTTNIQVYFITSEALGAPARVTTSLPIEQADGGFQSVFDLLPEPSTTTSYRFEHEVTLADPDMPLSFYADLVDLAGHEAHVSLGSTVIDNVVPQIDGGSVTPLLANATATVVATFGVTKPVVGNPDVHVGPHVMQRDVNVQPPAYRYALALKGTEPEGPQGVVVSLRDAAGNEQLASIGTVTFDFTGPRVTSALVRYVPAPGSVFSDVSSAGSGATVVVSVIADEPLAGAALVARSGGDTLSFPDGGVAGASATFAAVVTTATPDGVYQPEVTWSDLAGNPAARPLPLTVNVKTSKPPAPTLSSALTYVRSPFGAGAPEVLDGGGFTIPSGPYFALAPGDTLSGERTLGPSTFMLGETPASAVRVWADPAKTLLLGTALPLDGGTWPRMRLVNLDAPEVFVSGLDPAGNESEKATRVPYVEWVGTANGGVVPNPSSLDEVTFVEETLRPNSLFASLSSNDAGAVDGRSSVAVGDPAWRKRIISGAKPSGRYGAGLAYDAARGRVVLFGGWAAGIGTLNDTWEWDGEQWLRITPTGISPSNRYFPAMAYDAARGRVVLFGGQGDNRVQDTWEWDGTTWRQLSPPGPLPPARFAAAFAYDPTRRVLTMFGGDPLSNDTWEWNGSQWTQRHPPSAPTARRAASMAFDTASRRLLMFGGCSGPTGVCNNELWTWNGESASGAWSLVPATGTPPAARGFFAMAFDSRRGALVVTQGYASATTIYSDVVEFTNGGWVDRTSATVPTGRYGSAGMFDPAAGRTLVFGGTDGTSTPPSAESWVWDGARWVDATPNGVAVFKADHALAYDATRKRIVVQGGDLSSATALWNGYAWTITDGGPSVRSEAAMAGLPDGGVLLFGGAGTTYLQDTWQYDDAWANRTPPDAGPAPRAFGAMALDVSRGRVVHFGGVVGAYSIVKHQDDTWEWNGSAWQAFNPATKPLARAAHALVYDSNRSRVVLFGGEDQQSTRLNDTWEWDGAAWVDVSPPAMSRPAARWGFAMAFDALRGRTVVFGGGGNGTRLNDTWEWDGAAWVDRSPHRNAPPARSSQSAAFDVARGRVTMVSGISAAPNEPSEVWEWDAPAALQPAIQFTAQAPVVAVSSLTGLRVRAVAGGDFSPYSAADTGAELWIWSAAGRWEPVGVSNQSSPTSPAWLPAWSASLGTEANWYLERDGQLGFQVRPRGGSGLGGRTASVAVDYIEVRLRYAAP